MGIKCVFVGEAHVVVAAVAILVIFVINRGTAEQ